MSQLDSRLYTKKAAAEVTERLKKKLKNEYWSERGWASGRERERLLALPERVKK